MRFSTQKKIWIDLDNSPHIPFFKPIMDELVTRGYILIVTARDCFQVCGLADLMGIKYTPIGKHYGKHKAMKIIGSLIRVVQLLPTILRARPTIAVSHGSRTQQIVSYLLRIPNIIIYDYEHATKLLVFHPTDVIVPEIVAKEGVKYTKSRIHSYPGIKEDVYVPGFKPDLHLRKELGLGDNDIVTVIRPPASEAHYRSPESDKLFIAVIETLSAFKNVKMVILPRNEKQEEQTRSEWSELFNQGKIIIPKNVVDGLNLIWNSDFVISGGGTMNREAAALGVPVYSIFRGTTGAVDRYLEEKGCLTMLRSVEDVRSKIKPVQRIKEKHVNFTDKKALKIIVSTIEQLAQNS